MNDKQQTLAKLREIFNRWEGLLAGLSEEQITTPQTPSGWSIKDEIAHLWGWQKRTLARAEAALDDTEPQYPDWQAEVALDPEEDVDRTNAWLYEANHDKPWPNVHTDWREQFQRVLGLTEQTPESDLLAEGKYAWMGEYPLIDSLEGTLEHHTEHLEELLARRGSTEA